MSTELMEVIAGQGLGGIKFGMQREDVKAILGDPDEIEIFNFEEDEEILNESWHYDELNISLSFDQEEDWKLVNLAVSGEEYKLGATNVIGMEREDLINFLRSMGYTELEYEDVSTLESPDHKLISSEALGMNFWMEKGILSEVQWSPIFEDEETILWPQL